VKIQHSTVTAAGDHRGVQVVALVGSTRTMSRPYRFTPEVHEDEWAPGPVRAGAEIIKNFPPTGVRTRVVQLRPLRY